MRWLESLKYVLSVNPLETETKIRFAEPLSAHTTFSIGGPAEAWVSPGDYTQLSKVVRYCLSKSIPYLVVGRGSNILFSDRGFNGLVICLNSPNFSQIKVATTMVSVGAGTPLNKLINQMQKKSLSGLEFLSGIPASVGGAIVMNAGDAKKSIGSFVQSLIVMDRSGKIKLLKKGQLGLGYRRSGLDGCIILEALFKLAKQRPATIQKNLTAALAKKQKTQDLSARSAGCVFKNPQHRLSAAQMIEHCGLKSKTKGGAEISAKHANYIINRDQASCQDVLYLLKLAQRKVKKHFGVRLEPEIRIVK
ncbi:UDP-N-acetylmuramate dehydrogenase [Candidatus Omnitrophota bacterium]